MTTSGPVSQPVVTVTLADIYAELRKLQDQVAAMTPQATQLNDHESRLRSLEKWKYALPISAVMAVAAVIASIMQATGK